MHTELIWDLTDTHLLRSLTALPSLASLHFPQNTEHSIMGLLNFIF